MWTMDLNIRSKTLGVYIDENNCKVRFDNDFLDLAPKTKEKKKNNQRCQQSKVATCSIGEKICQSHVMRDSYLKCRGSYNSAIAKNSVKNWSEYFNKYFQNLQMTVSTCRDY